MEDNKECIKDQGSAGFESMHRLQPTTERALIATADVFCFFFFYFYGFMSCLFLSSFQHLLLLFLLLFAKPFNYFFFFLNFSF